MKTRTITLVLVAFFWLCLGRAQAVPITIQISGEVTSVAGTGKDSVSDTIYAGVTFTGTYTYDTLAVDLEPDIHRGTYQFDSSCGMTINIGGYDIETAPTPTGQLEMSIYNDVTDDGIIDRYAVFSYGNISTPSDGLELGIAWYLSDSTHDAIASDALPTEAPVLADWSYNSFSISGFDSLGRTIVILGTVTQAAPEPLTGVFFAIGALFLRQHRR